MTYPELLAPAGSPESLKAALLAGADAIYLGYGEANARRRAKGFSQEEFASALRECRLRGVLVYLTLNTLLTDRELAAALETAAFAVGAGVDALIVQDLGLLALLRERLPDTALHASTQMSLHSSGGLHFAAARGLSRVVLARELSRAALEKLERPLPCEIETFVHGALCMCYSGQCYFSAMLGERSGNRGLCAQPCRLAYRAAGEEGGKAQYPLSLKDLSLSKDLQTLAELGVACLKIEGRMKSPSYVAPVTQVYASLLREARVPTQQEAALLAAAFSREGFTRGYFTGRVDGSMFGMRREGETAPPEVLALTQRIMNGKETPRVGLQLHCRIRAGEAVLLLGRDAAGHESQQTGPLPEVAQNRPLTREQVEVQLRKMGGTVFFVEDLVLDLEEGLSLPLSAFNALRRALLDDLQARREAVPKRRVLAAALPLVESAPAPRSPALMVSLRTATQLSPALLEEPGHLARIDLPLMEYLHAGEAIQKARALAPTVPFAARLPRIIWDEEWPRLERALAAAESVGVRELLLGTWDAYPALHARGFALRGDFSLGCYNSQTLKEMQRLGFLSATASVELNLAQIRDLKKPLPLELIAYGRLPLMLTEHCLLPKGTHCQSCEGGCTQEPSYLRDRRGACLPILPAFGGRSELLGAKVLYLADRWQELKGLGLSAARLLFTTESPARCVEVLRAYAGAALPPPEDFTRGLYFRKTE